MIIESGDFSVDVVISVPWIIYGSHWSKNNVNPNCQRNFVIGCLVAMMGAAHFLDEISQNIPVKVGLQK